MGENPILLESSQINKRADAKLVVDIAAVDDAATVDTPDSIAVVVGTPDAPRPEGGTHFKIF